MQLAKGVFDGYDYAIKFFADRRSLDAALHLYAESPAAAQLPKVQGVWLNESRAVDAGRVPLPPCIVLEKGECLLDTMLRSSRSGNGLMMLHEQRMALRVRLHSHPGMYCGRSHCPPSRCALCLP